jgi:hypothetical protein
MGLQYIYIYIYIYIYASCPVPLYCLEPNREYLVVMHILPLFVAATAVKLKRP